MTNSQQDKAPTQMWFTWVIAASLTLPGVTSLSPMELFCKALLAVITVATVRETCSWIKRRRTSSVLPPEA
ncbi:hypothetical protein ACFQ7Z_10780 [Streptomyces virginiae]|uniref:hypothetical protein n=1 Tax=Streptomyces virginiae TaxID=1961 RepID=UPI0036AEC0F9